MGFEIYPSIIGPPPMPNGGLSLPAGSGLQKWITVRDDTDGAVDNAETLCQISSGKGKLTTGLINISHIKTLTIFALPTFAALTSIDVIPVYLDDPLNGSSGYEAIGSAPASSVITLTRLKYRLGTTALALLWNINNPGANFVQFVLASAGVITSSSIVLKVGLGWTGNSLRGST